MRHFLAAVLLLGFTALLIVIGPPWVAVAYFTLMVALTTWGSWYSARHPNARVGIYRRWPFVRLDRGRMER